MFPPQIPNAKPPLICYLGSILTSPTSVIIKITAGVAKLKVEN